MVTSLMFVAAKPIEETSAKANVASQTIHPASAVARLPCPGGHRGQDQGYHGDAKDQEQCAGDRGRAHGLREPAILDGAHPGERERGDQKQ